MPDDTRADSPSPMPTFIVDADEMTSPDTMADFLEATIADARGLNRKRYRPEAELWHSPAFNGECRVCLAGCFIAAKLRPAINTDIDIADVSSAVANKLKALDFMRTGNWSVAFKFFYSVLPDSDTERQLNELPIPADPYFATWIEFDLHLRSLDAIVPRLRGIEQQP